MVVQYLEQCSILDAWLAFTNISFDYLSLIDELFVVVLLFTYGELWV